MKRLVFALTLALATPALADTVTGNLAIAGLDIFTNNSITFVNPATVLLATGTLSPMQGATNLILNNQLNFSAEPQTQLFQWEGSGTTVSMVIHTFAVNHQNAFFLNVLGSATIFESGLDPTKYNFSLASTRPDGTTSYTLDIVQLTPVGEPSSLILLGTGLLSMALVYWIRRKGVKIIER